MAGTHTNGRWRPAGRISRHFATVQTTSAQLSLNCRASPASGRKARRVDDEVTWWPQTDDPAVDRVAVLTVSYNTKELTALLLWSLWRVLEARPAEVVIVDNGSTDGSRELLDAAQSAGLCTLVANRNNEQHGPGLNKGLSSLAAQELVPTRVWILDSDCVVARPETLRELLAVDNGAAAIVGESEWDPWHELDTFRLSSLFVDPARVWRPEVGRFADDGDPGFPVLESASQLGLSMAEFPFTEDGYVIHRGRGTLAAVLANGERSNPHYEWAVDHHKPHFNEVPTAERRWNELRRRFRAEVPELTGSALAAACHR